MIAQQKYTNQFSRSILVLGLLLFCSVFAWQVQAQDYLERQAIGSSGNSSTSTGSLIHLSSTIGEAVVGGTSSSSYKLNQGFQQSNYVAAEPRIIDFVQVINESCLGAENGLLEITITGCQAPYVIDWSSGDTGAVASNLSAGNYTVSVTGANNCQVQNTIDLDADLEVPCALEIYTGITPNNDGNNDTWIIDNIEFFPVNEVSIHTRSGNLVWEAVNYDNNFVVWDGTNNSGNDLPSDTYWYVLKVLGKTYRGWVEVTR